MPAKHISLRFRTTVDAEELLQGWMMMHATIEGIEENAGETFFYLPQAEWNPELEAAIRSLAAANSGIEYFGSESIEDRDWNAEWEASIEPEWATDELLISPSWKLEEARAMSAKHLITIDPKMSFGTGHHETTRLCLHAIESLDVKDKSILDVGTGTGVLAIYALLRGAQSAVGIDTDEWSIENVAENRGLNNIADARFEIRKGTLTNTVPQDERFDLILANIHRNVLIEIAGDILMRCKPGASVVLSGLLVYDADEVRAIYEGKGFTFIREERENEWACLILQCA